jgi:hypothetical protein
MIYEQESGRPNTNVDVERRCPRGTSNSVPSCTFAREPLLEVAGFEPT